MIEEHQPTNELADKVDVAGVEEDLGKEARAKEDLNPEEIQETGNEGDQNEPGEKEGEALQDQEVLEETKIECEEAKVELDEQMG